MPREEQVDTEDKRDRNRDQNEDVCLANQNCDPPDGLCSIGDCRGDVECGRPGRPGFSGAECIVRWRRYLATTAALVCVTAVKLLQMLRDLLVERRPPRLGHYDEHLLQHIEGFVTL